MEKPVQVRSVQTKVKIKEAALTLFNLSGVEQVHTHDIAKKAKLSPGNLYYHYKNKEEIIREICAEVPFLQPKLWEQHLLDDRETGFAEFVGFVMSSLSSYRFLFRDLSLILRADPTLKRWWSSRYKELDKVMGKAVHVWVQRGLMRPMPEASEVQAFIDLNWLVLTHAGSSPRNQKTASENEIKKTFRDFLWPYHTQKGQQLLMKEIPNTRTSL